MDDETKLSGEGKDLILVDEHVAGPVINFIEEVGKIAVQHGVLPEMVVCWVAAKILHGLIVQADSEEGAAQVAECFTSYLSAHNQMVGAPGCAMVPAHVKYERQNDA